MRKFTLLVLAISAFILPVFSQVQIDKSINLSGSGTDAKISGIKDVSAVDDAVNVAALQSGKLHTATSVTGTNAISLTFTPAITAATLQAGMILTFKAVGNNTTAVTLDVDGGGALTARALFKNVSTNLVANDIQNNQMVTVIYDGANFQLLSRGEFTEVDGSTTNELQTIAGGPGANDITLSNSGGTITFNGGGLTSVSRSGNTYTISSTGDGNSGGTVTGTGVATRVAFWGGSSSLSSSGNFTWDNANSYLDIAGRVSGSSFKVGSTFGDLTNNAPWYGIGMSNLTLPNQGSTAVQIGGYYGINFAESGANRMVINTGNVGIGSTNPGQRLTIEGNAEIRSGNYLMLRPGDNSWDMRLNATGQRLDILSGGALGTSIATFVHGGNVGIGTASPGARLDLQGGAFRQGDLTTYVKTVSTGASSISVPLFRQFHDAANWGYGGVLVEVFTTYYQPSVQDYGMHWCEYGYSGNSAAIVTKISGGSVPWWNTQVQTSGNYYYRDLYITIPAYYTMTIRMTTGEPITTNSGGVQSNVIYFF